MEKSQSRCIYFFPFIFNVLFDFPSFEAASLMSQRQHLSGDLSQKAVTEAAFLRTQSIGFYQHMVEGKELPTIWEMRSTGLGGRVARAPSCGTLLIVSSA